MSTFFHVLVWFAMVFLLLRFGYGSHVMGHGKSQSSDEESSGQRQSKDLRWIPPIKDIDPVCSKTISTDRAKPSVHDGHVYYFCSRECRERFEAAPEQYVGPQNQHPIPQLENNHA